MADQANAADAGSKFNRVSTASFRGERGDATVRLPSGFPMQEGAKLAEACFVGKLLGEGIQVRHPTTWHILNDLPSTKNEPCHLTCNLQVLASITCFSSRTHCQFPFMVY